MGETPDARPDPDALLAQLREDERARERGKLRVYFGASAGVGKTYAMLSAAQRAQREGVQVLVGVVETHGRKETMEMLADLPQLPLRRVPQRMQLQEFDLDAALRAKPRIVLVDELAHSNAPGSRHPKRWQDIDELLDAGMDVWTALNVQHLESLNGTVGAITGIRVNETVPDTVLDAADEVILVDVTADELLERLKAGKVYLPQQAEHARNHFFRKGNLFALREIALRRTAEHVGDDVRSYRARHVLRHVHGVAGRAPAWNTSGELLVCVGPVDGAEHAVRSAARLAGQLNVRWHAAYVETPSLQRLPAAQRDRTLAVLKLAEELGARTAVLSGDDVAGALIAHAQMLNCATLVLGRSRVTAWPWLLRPWRAPLQRQLAALAPTLDVLEIGSTDSVRRLDEALPVRALEVESDADWHMGIWPRYALAAGACVATTLLTTPLLALFDLANIVMVFLLCVVLVAVRLGRGPAMLAAVLAVASFDFFFVPPRFSFAVSDVQYLLTFVVMLGVGLLIGQLTANLRFSARVSASRERRAQALFELTRDLSAALQTEQVLELGEAAVRRSFGGPTKILLPDASDQLVLGETLPPDLDASLADWTFHHAQRAGMATGTLPSSAWHFVPLKAPMRIRGVLALQPRQPRWLLIPEQVQQLETLARQIAIALERVHYVEVAQSALVQMESERLRNTLLAAMSHDVRTPLTALVGQAEALALSPRLSAQDQLSAHSISQDARDVSALVTKLLEMARLESGQVDLHKDWQSVEEVIGSAIRAARHALGGLVVQTEIAPQLPLVEFDASLIERVLVNLLENAAKYGVAPGHVGAAIVVHAELAPGMLLLRVRDFGPGLPGSAHGGALDLFEKFTRGQSESHRHGVGLGLAICKAIVLAHRGQITATQAQGQGAEFCVSLPRAEPPALPAPEVLP